MSVYNRQNGRPAVVLDLVPEADLQSALHCLCPVDDADLQAFYAPDYIHNANLDAGHVVGKIDDFTFIDTISVLVLILCATPWVLILPNQ